MSILEDFTYGLITVCLIGGLIAIPSLMINSVIHNIFISIWASIMIYFGIFFVTVIGYLVRHTR